MGDDNSLEDVEEIRRVLMEKPWFGFDLDDTLHNFRKAAGKAIDATLEYIALTYAIPIKDLEMAYVEILRERTANAFVDGKTSREYRQERFSALLDQIPMQWTDDSVGEILQLYERTLADSLELKDGAISLLRLLRSMGKKIAVITEGPQDAQERAIQALGVKDEIDFLATTNFFQVSKVDGLFGKVLTYLKIQGGDMVYVGDSETRDVVPAVNAGMYVVHFSEGEKCSLNTFPIKINAWERLERILSGS